MAGAFRGLLAMRIRRLPALVIGFALAACAGRDPHPVAVVQPQDAQSDCAMIRAEIEANNAQAEKLAEENHAKIAQNVAAGVVGVVIWPVLVCHGCEGCRRNRNGRACRAPAISCFAGGAAVSAAGRFATAFSSAAAAISQRRTAPRQPAEEDCLRRWPRTDPVMASRSQPPDA
jgi:hypothetical protein